jgi:hypothetical protein
VSHAPESLHEVGLVGDDEILGVHEDGPIYPHMKQSLFLKAVVI